MLSCQLAAYPLGTADYREIIREALKDWPADDGLEVQVGLMSTVISGEEEGVWLAARALWQRLQERHGDLVLQVTFSNCCACKVEG